MKKSFFTIILFAAVFVIAVKAASADPNAHGWPWGGSETTNDGTINGNESGLGWLSMNGSDAGAGGSYYVFIPPKTCAYPSTCNVTGYAWMGNDNGGSLGWIDFAPQDHCTTGSADSTHYKAASCSLPAGVSPAPGVSGPGVYRVYNALAGTDQLVGWARFVGIAQETANPNGNNAGGEDGWIALGNVDPAMNTYNYNVSISGNSVSGYGWAGPTLGALSFNSVTLPVAPTITTLTATPSPIYLDATNNTIASKTVTLGWTFDVPSDQIASCAASCTDDNGVAIAGCPAAWTGATWSSGTVTVSLPAAVTNYNLTCTGTNGLVSNQKTARVIAGCAWKTCGTGSGTCSFDPSTFTAMSTWDANACADHCTSTADCIPRQSGTWREIAPQ